MFEAPSHWIIVLVVVALLFGYKKLPEASRSLGRSLRIFKTEIKGMNEDDAARAEAKTVEAPVTQPAADPTPDAPSVVDVPVTAENPATPGTPTV